jgi:hypothetical protein
MCITFIYLFMYFHFRFTIGINYFFPPTVYAARYERTRQEHSQC